VVLFECLAGYRPFIGDTPITTALAHLREPVPDLPDFVPADLAAVVRRALAKKPGDRFASAADFAAALRNPGAAQTQPPVVAPVPLVEPLVEPDGSTQVLPGFGSTTQTPGTPAPGTPPPDDSRRRRSPVWLWVLLALAVLAIVAVLIITQLNNASDQPTTPSTPTSTRTSQQSSPTKESSSPSSPTTNADAVTIDSADYVGRDIKEVESELRDLGLRVAKERLDNPGDESENAVESVNPDGDLLKGDEVTVSYWGKAPGPGPTSPATSAPTTSPTTPAASAPTSPLTPADSTSAAAGAETTPAYAAQQPKKNGKGNQG
jgi:eukaryotic-like serine/threonine-protein kinase